MSADTTCPGGEPVGGEPAGGEPEPQILDLESYRGVCDLFAALSSPARAAVIHLLDGAELTVGEIHEHLAISQPLLSQHLKILRDHHLIQGRREGRSIRYRLADDHVAHIFLDAMHHTGHQD